MTLLLTKTGIKHPSRSDEDSFLIGLNPETNQVRYYEDLSDPSSSEGSDSATTKRIKFPATLLAQHSLDFRMDLSDPGVLVCSSELLDIFKESFDCDTIAPAFIKNMLGNEGVYCSYIHAHIQEGYALRARDVPTYQAVTRDLLARWVHPLVPDNNFLGRPAAFAYSRNNVYKEAGAKCAPLARLGRNVALGAGTVVENRAALTRATVGRNCAIARGATVSDAILWDNVVVGENAIVRGAIVADGATILSGARVEEGAMIGSGVVIGKDGVVPANTYIVTSEYATMHEFSILEPPDGTSFGEGFNGVIMMMPDDGNDDEEDEDDDEDGEDGDGEYEDGEYDEDEYDDDDDEYDEEEEDEDEEENEYDDDDEDNVGGESGDIHSDKNFEEIQKLCSSFIDGQSSASDLDMQLKNTRISLTISQHVCLAYFVCSLVKYAVDLDCGDFNKFLRKIVMFFDRFAAPLRNIVLSEEEQTVVLDKLVDFCYGPDRADDDGDDDDLEDEVDEDDYARRGFPYVLKWLYEYEIISEEAIFAWNDAMNELGTKRSMIVDDEVNKQIIIYILSFLFEFYYFFSVNNSLIV